MFSLGRIVAANPTPTTIRDLQKLLSENLAIDLDDRTVGQLLKLKFPVELEIYPLKLSLRFSIRK